MVQVTVIVQGYLKLRGSFYRAADDMLPEISWSYDVDGLWCCATKLGMNPGSLST